jgi:Xaa-Pro aminopeptidase
MKPLFGSDFFRGNRERLRQLFAGTAPIVVTANALLQKAMDEPFPFHQDRNFWYLTGIDEPGVILVMEKGREYLIVPPREVVREQFDGAIDFGRFAAISGIDTIYYEKDGWKQLSARLKKVQNVATLGAAPKYISQLGFYTNPARAELIFRLKEINSEIELLDLRQHLGRMRMVKHPAEVEAIQKAIDITADAIKYVTRPARLPKYTYEYEVEADLARQFRCAGARGHAFQPIVSGGERACTLHQVRNEMPLNPGELLLMDVGAQYEMYAADLTRTVVIGPPAKRQQQVYDAVAAAQDYAYGLLKPGAKLRDYEKQMEQFIGEKLRELSLIKSIETETVRHYFPHAVSHFLGLDTHDSGDYDRPLEPGTVLTVEPGIYIPQEQIGVRIEDDIIITTGGNEIMSRHLPRQLVV